MKINNTRDLTKGYKGYNSDFTCTPSYNVLHQYAENTIHELPKDEELECCKTGFHYCINPLDVLDFYSLIGKDGELNVLTRVEALGNVNTDEKNCNKHTTDKIKIGEKLSLEEYVDECIEYIKENCENGDDYASQLATCEEYYQVATNKNFSSVATSGNCSQIATSGYGSQIATSGNDSHVTTSGYSSQVVTSGNCSKITASGEYSQIATSGDNSWVTTSGDCSQIAINGKCSKATASGVDSRVNIQSNNSVGVNIGIGGAIKGVLGTWIALAEYDEDDKCIGIKSAKIDGEELKENVWYTLKNGEFVRY